MLPPPPSLVCPWRDDLPPFLLEPAWAEFATLGLVETVAGAPPAQKTRVQVARDARELRVRFHCEDTRPWATLSQRDGPLWTEEVVEVFLDPFGDAQCYFEVEINPLGAVCDLVLRRIASGWRKDFSWHVEGLRAAAAPCPGGWRAELSVPFAALGPGVGKPGAEPWRVNFLRVDRPAGVPDSPAELSAWSPTGERNFHRAERFGTLAFEPPRPGTI